MSWFNSSKISLGSASVAEQLRVTRERLGLSIAQVADKIKVSPKYLQALEDGDYYKVPDGIYTLSFLRQYAQYLGLDYKKIISGFQSEKSVFSSDQNENIFSRQVVGADKMLVVPNLVKNIIWSLLLLSCLVYLIWLMNNVFKAPMLKVLTPIDDLATVDSNLLVSGYSEPEAEVTINERSVTVSAEGEFNLGVELQPGINTIVVQAKKGSKKPSTVVKEVLLNLGQ
jgi:cytoskeletal protein RodZ